MLTLQIPVLVLWFGESRVFVEQRGYKGHVELGVSTHDIGGSYKLSAAEALGLCEHILCSLSKILLLVTHKQAQVYILLGKTGICHLGYGTSFKWSHRLNDICVTTDPAFPVAFKYYNFIAVGNLSLCISAYIKTSHVDLNLRNVLFTAVWSNLLKQVEVRLGVLHRNRDAQTHR